MAGEDASIVVPATSANLGCGFDCAGLAVNLYLKVRGRLGRSGEFRCRYQGPGAELVPLDSSNLIARAALAAARRAGAGIAGGEIEIENEIPMARGLGSSAAAIVAGILLVARHLDRPLDAELVLELAAELEGHPDNIAAALHGGMVVSAQDAQGKIRFARATLPADLDFIAVVPDRELSTERARGVLPASYARQDAVANLQRLSLLVATCFSGKFQIDPELFLDRLHQPYRAPLVPGLEACFELRHPDLLGVFLSGAGSSVMAMARRNAAEIGERLAEQFTRRGVGARVLLLKAENRGALDFFEGSVA
ncbi:MAG TPA: homoserine kinase [Patescibacteria group bacterium]|nr:homoserine kinase [Patescibacteria group bacterium]